MGRVCTGPKHFPSMGGYYATVRGERRCLGKSKVDDKPDGPHYLAAQKAFLAWMEETEAPSYRHRTLRDVVDAYTDALAKARKPSVKAARSYLATVVKATRNPSLADLKVGRILDAIDDRPSWAGGTKRQVLVAVKAAFSAALRRDEVAVDPFSDIVVPESYRSRRRGAAYYLPPDLRALIIGSVSPALAWLLRGLEATGARPIELREARREHWSHQDRAIVYSGDATDGYRWKNASKGGRGARDRFVLFPDNLADEVEAVLKRRSIIFPNSKGGAWWDTTIHHHFTKLRAAPAIVAWCRAAGRDPETIIPYGFRHTVATDKIAAGLPIALVAAALGTSVAMLERHYSHVIRPQSPLRAAFLSC